MTLIGSLGVEDIPLVVHYGLAEPRFAPSGRENGFWSEQQILAWCQNLTDVLLVAKDESVFQGFVLSSLHSPTGKATIENLYILPEHRRCGIGRILLGECVSRLQQNGATYISAFLEADNNAILQLFQSMGFSRGKLVYWTDKSFSPHTLRS